MMTMLRNKKGFTLIEILIVIIVLGILAMIIVPQITVSTDDAKISTVQSDLSSLRSAIEIYYAQHKNKYPGQTKKADGSANTSDTGEAASSMVAQLTQYTNSDGQTAATKSTTFKYGPYIRGLTLPTNPFNEKTGVVCDATDDITLDRTANSAYGWKFHFRTGVFYAADHSDHLAY